MPQRLLWVMTLVCGVVLGLGVARADGSDEGAEHAGSAEPEHHEGSAAPEHHEGSAEEHHDGSAAEPEHHEADHHEGSAEHEGEQHEGEHHEGEHHEGEHHEETATLDDGDDDADPSEPKRDPFDEDGDGKLEPEELADRAEWNSEFKGISDEPDEAALEKRPLEDDLKPSLDAETFRKMVRIAKKVVLPKMDKKIAAKAAKKMATFSMCIEIFSLFGVLLLLTPLVLAKKYPGQGKVLLKYSALAAATFIVTVNLFGGVLILFRTVQTALSSYTNPSIAIAGGVFDTLDNNAEEYIVMGKELFAPTLEQMQAHPDEQPSVLILENGQRIVKDAKVFVSVAKLFKKVDFIFAVLPIVLMLVTMILFILAIRPTLTEIVKLPAMAASGQGGVGGAVLRRSMKRVIGELIATICTIGVLVVLTLISGFVLGEIVGPALDALLTYFARAVSYLQFVEGASSGLVFVTLFGVILFLVLNLASLIVSMSFFLGKCQKIFQQRFNDGVPLATHARYFKWGIPSVLLVQVFPWVFVFICDKILHAINDSIMSGATDARTVSWTKLMLAGPLFMVAGYVLLFWAARGLKAIKFLQSYKVKVATPAPKAET